MNSIHHVHDIHSIHYIRYHKPPPPHHGGERSIYNIYIYINMLHIYIYIYVCVCVCVANTVSTIYTRYTLNTVYIYTIYIIYIYINVNIHYIHSTVVNKKVRETHSKQRSYLESQEASGGVNWCCPPARAWAGSRHAYNFNLQSSKRQNPARPCSTTIGSHQDHQRAFSFLCPGHAVTTVPCRSYSLQQKKKSNAHASWIKKDKKRFGR